MYMCAHTHTHTYVAEAMYFLAYSSIYFDVYLCGAGCYSNIYHVVYSKIHNSYCMVNCALVYLLLESRGRVQ